MSLAPRGVVAGLALGVAGVTLYVALRWPAGALLGGGRLAVEVAAGVALGVAGAIAPERGALVGASGAVWLAAEFENPETGAVLFSLGLVLGVAAPALLAHALLGRCREVLAAYVALVLVAGLGAAVASDPRANGCGACPANLLLVADAPAAADWLGRWGLLTGAAALAACLLVAGARVWRASGAARRGLLPVLVPGSLFLALIVVSALADPRREWTATSAALRAGESVALFGVAAGVVWQRLGPWRLRGRLARLVVELADAPRPGGVRDLLAAAVGDPSLTVFYAFDGGWIDWEGKPRTLPERRLTSLVQEGEVTAVVAHAGGGFEDELSSAARLAIDHERLQAVQRGQLARLRAARAAIVAAADGERRRLERDLHDGAQQALAGLAMAIGLQRAGVPGGTLADAHEKVREALDRVRALAHATYPAALDEAGLAAALDVLSEWRPHVDLGALPQRRLEPVLETGAYFIVVALTRASALVDVRVADDLQLEIATADGVDLTEAEDRVGALGGRLKATGGHVEVYLPCA